MNDYKIVTWEDFKKHTRPEDFEICQIFDEKCKKHKGELVLVIETKEEQMHKYQSRGCFPTGIDSYLKRTTKIGMLKKDNDGLVICEYGMWFFPTGTYYILDDLGNRPPMLIKGNLYVSTLGSFLEHLLDKPVGKSTFGYRFPMAMELADEPKVPLQLEIKIGNNEVIEWFRKNKENFLNLLKVSKLLGLQLPEIPEMPELANKKRHEIASEICQLIQKSVDLKKFIEAIDQKVGKGTFSVDGFSITQVEDKTDAIFFTWGQREKLKEAKGRISSLLSEAESIGISKEEIAETIGSLYSQLAKSMFDSLK